MLIITTTTTTIGQLKENSWLTRTELKDMGYEKLMNQKDEQIAMESMLGQRKLTTGNEWDDDIGAVKWRWVI